MRLIWWVGCLTLGTAIALLSGSAPILVASLAPVPIGAAFWFIRHHRTTWAEGIVACAIGVYAGARAGEVPRLAPEIAAVLDSDQKVSVEGWVMTAPEPVPPREGSRLRVAMERIEGTPARATVALAVAAGMPDLLPGDAVQFTAGLRSVRGLANPGLADSAAQARADGIDVFAGVGAPAAVRRLRDGEIAFPWRAPTAILRAATRARLALGRSIDRVVVGGAGTFLHTTVLGERRNTDAAVEDGFRAAGATHVLSVSGLHLAAVAVVFFVGVRWLLVSVPRLPLWLEPRAAAAVVALPAIAFYTLITGSAIATVRSALMMAVGLVGILIGRRNTSIVAVATAVLVMLGWSPLVLVDISFQLSAVSVLALALLVPRLDPGRGVAAGRATADAAASWVARPLAWIAGLAAASVAAGLTTAPIVAHHFGEVTPAAPLGNLLLVPLVEFIVVPCGLFGAALGAILGRPFSLPLLTVAGWASRAALWLADGFRNHAPVWLTRAPNAFETAALCLGLACALACVRAPRGGYRSRPLAACGAFLLGAGLASIGVREVQRRWSRNLTVTFLDIGQGDAAVVQIPGGGTIVIDGGGTYDGSFDPGARILEPFLRGRGITHLTAVALSHPHPDHLGGLHRILARFPVDCLWTSGDDGHNPDYARLLVEARARGVPTPIPSRWEGGGVVIEPLGPFVVDSGGGGRGERIGAPEGTTVNDASLILRVGYDARSVLFTGDIEANGEGELAGRTALGQVVASDVLKVPHHGSRTSSGRELLDAVHPRIAVISLGWRNRFHFPRPEVIERYRERGIRLLRTDLNGAITVTIHPDGAMFATCERGCR